MCKLVRSIIAFVAVTAVCIDLPHAIAESSDFNFDGRVDAADLARWEAAFASVPSAASEQADADLDGDTDGNDFLSWQREASDNDAILAPEPATIALAVPFVLFLIARRNRPTSIHRFEQAHATLKPSDRLLQLLSRGRHRATAQTSMASYEFGAGI